MKALWLCVLGDLVCGCVADVGEEVDPPAIKEQQFDQFSPLVFAFYTTIQDDGRGEAGGYQEAFARLEFPGVKFGLICPVKVGMAIRSSQDGIVTHQRAAEITALVATAGASNAYHSRPRWVGPEFCAVGMARCSRYSGMCIQGSALGSMLDLDGGTARVQAVV